MADKKVKVKIDVETNAEGSIAQLKELKKQLKEAEELGFLILDHSMQIYGICKPCQTKMKK